ncbi:MAG: aminotransferase [Alphaproteobacteria bacterium]|nr:MAG: aminotransferase [Alphaproteobacteria bacterium]
MAGAEEGLAVTPWLKAVEAPAIAVARAWVAGRQFPSDHPLIDLAQAVPGHPPPAALLDHLAEAVRDPASHRYTEILGLPRLREVHANHLSTVYRAPIAADRVGITAGCNQAFCAALQALAAAGDNVLLPTPWYFNHKMWLDMLGVEVRPLSFRPDAGGVPDVAEAAAKIDSRTRAIILVTPNNPTGAIYPPAVLEAFYALAQRHRLALVLDETYKDYLPSAEPAHRLFEDPAWGGTVVQLYSFSKVFALTGHRVGSITASTTFLAEVEKILDCVAICAPNLGQRAALFGLEHLGPWVAGNTADLAARADAFRSGFQGLSGWRLISLGAYFAYLQHPFPEAGLSVAKRLADQHNMLLLPGSFFGVGQDPFLRLAFANATQDQVPEVMRRLGASLG